MKRLFLIILFVIGILFVFGNSNTTFAQQPELINVNEEEGGVATKEAALVVVEYQLPYPGILPDHPLYKLKMLRDRILDLLTTNQIKKVNFYLLQGDKRLAASILLVEKGNETLAETTSSKGLDYLEKTISKTNELKNTQESIEDTVLKLKLSTSKHREEIAKLKDQTTGEISKRFEAQLKRAMALEKIVKDLNP